MSNVKEALIKEFKQGGIEVLITHKNCMDGVGVILAVTEIFKDYGDKTLQVVKYQYGDDTKELFNVCEGKKVLMADMSLKRDKLLELNKICKSFLLIDHHKTAEEDLSGLDFVVFDMNESGATLVWKTLTSPRKAIVPQLLRYIKDRDIGEWLLPYTDEVSNGLKLIDFDDIKEFRKYLYDVRPLLTEGEVITKQINKAKRDIVKNVDLYKVGEHKEIPITNDRHLITELGSELSLIYPYVIFWFVVNDKIVVSMRSSKHNPNHVDVSEIAMSRGGGGHKHAAGYSLPITELGVLMEKYLYV